MFKGNILIPLENGEEIMIPQQLLYKAEYGSEWRTADGSEAESFLSWAGSNQYGGNVYRISQEFNNDDHLELYVTKWYPDTCQGRGFPTFSFASGRCQDFWSQEIFWSRSQALVPEAVWKGEEEPMLLPISKEQSLNHAFDTILQADLKRIEITKMKDEIAYDILYQKLLHHPTITKIELPNTQYCKGALVNFCCNLIINSDTLEEVFFQDIGSLNEEMVLKLFKAVNISRNVKVLDLRTSRYLETWSKASSGGRFNVAKPILPAESIWALAALKSSSGCPLEKLDFGGNAISSTSSISPLMTTLLSSSLGLKKVSFRGCDLTEEGLLAIATDLENNDCLEILDLSHNVITKPVMERLADSLVKNKTLRELKLEHCRIDLESIEYLASSLPEIEGLRNLYMDGNEFTWEPLTETNEAVGAVAILKALEDNTSLHSLEMGESGKLTSYSRLCCTPPHYHTTLSGENLEELGLYLVRNAILWEEMKESRSQQAVVRIAEILLGKLTDDGE